MKFIRFLKYLKLNNSNISTQNERAEERLRQILLTTISSGFSKVVTAAISFGIIPLLLVYLGTEKFGLWMTISSVVALISIADMGIGSGLMNAVAQAQGKDDIQGIRNQIGAGYVLLTALAVLMVLIFFVAEPFINWRALFNIKEDLYYKDVTQTIAVFVILFAISMPASVAIKVLMGLQMGFFANLWIAAGSFAGLGAVLFVIHVEGGLPSLAAATIAPTIMAGIFAGLYLLGKQKPYLKPQFREFSFRHIKLLASTSGLFFILQISGLIAFQSDYMIVSYYLGPEAVALYAVAFKLFTIPSVCISIFLSALWPAYAEANSRGDMNWIYKSFKKSLRYSAIIAVPMSIVILILGPWIIRYWVGDQIKPTWGLLVGLFAWSILTILGGNFSALMNGLGVIKFQTVASVAMAMASIILSIWLVKIIGVSGVVWGSVISLTFVLYLPSFFYLKKYFKKNK